MDEKKRLEILQKYADLAQQEIEAEEKKEKLEKKENKMTTLTDDQKQDILQTHAQRYAKEVAAIEAQPDPSEAETLFTQLNELGKNRTANKPQIEVIQKRLKEIEQQEAESKVALAPILAQQKAERLAELEDQENSLSSQFAELDRDLNKMKWGADKWEKYDKLKTDISLLQHEIRSLTPPSNGGVYVRR